MRTLEDNQKLSKARALSQKMFNEIQECVKNRNFPVYYDNLLQRRLKVDYLIIDLKYK